MSKTILIVEDEIFVAMDLERILCDAGFVVTGIAADHASALEEDVRADIAFVDVNLRDGQTGATIACDLSARNGTKVFYVTANPAQIEPVAQTALGYIRKPFTAEAIRLAAEIAANDGVNVEINSEITLFPCAAA